VSPESFVYGAIIGVALAFLLARLTGRPLTLRRLTALDIVTGALIIGVPYATQALGVGFEMGLLLVFAAIVVVYAWRRLRPQPS
jgi:hypothetical protein